MKKMISTDDDQRFSQLCPDMINAIISFLPRMTQISITKERYVYFINRLVTTHGFCYALKIGRGRGIFPYVFLERVSLERDRIIFDTSKYFGKTEDIFMRWIDELTKHGHSLTHLDFLPHDLSQENAKKILHSQHRIDIESQISLIAVAKEEYHISSIPDMKQVCIKHPEIARYYPYTQKELLDAIRSNARTRNLKLEEFERKYILRDTTFTTCATSSDYLSFRGAWTYDRMVMGRKLDRLTREVNRLTSEVDTLRGIVDDLMKMRR